MKPFSIIVGFDSQYGIGKNGQLPWHLPLDLIHFKNITSAVSDPSLKNALIMGRKTWDSLPQKFRPLPGRENLVLTKTGKLNLPPVVLSSSSLDDALDQLTRPTIENIFVIGGQQVYAQAINHPLCQKLYVTHVQGQYACDSFFPPISRQFIPVSASEFYTDGTISFQFSEYLRQI
ncbi:MAG: dihydrofolate reductase [Candidatus Omnitrophica bacterium]|nr:dihydrofolate reductase [Candidatus Omnitrophota bacterium]